MNDAYWRLFTDGRNVPKMARQRGCTIVQKFEDVALGKFVVPAFNREANQ
jgi:hypothetical protein